MEAGWQKEAKRSIFVAACAGLGKISDVDRGTEYANGMKAFRIMAASITSTRRVAGRQATFVPCDGGCGAIIIPTRHDNMQGLGYNVGERQESRRIWLSFLMYLPIKHNSLMYMELVHNIARHSTNINTCGYYCTGTSVSKDSSWCWLAM